MASLLSLKRLGLVLLSIASLAACQVTPLATPPTGKATPTQPAPENPVKKLGGTVIDVPYAWGGEMRCGAYGCRLVVVEHEKSKVLLFQMDGREARLLDSKQVAYHPDSAIWLADDLFAVAVEASFSLDIFQTKGEKAELKEQIPIGISPRDVVLIERSQGRYKLLATPYDGKEVVWVDYDPENKEKTHIQKSEWCTAPWHPVRLSRAPGAPSGGVAIACLDGKQVAFAPWDALTQKARTLLTIPVEGYIVPRATRPSPSGRWLYVALETRQRNLRFNLDTEELQWIDSPLTGAVSVLPLADDLVLWGDDQHLYLQQLNAQGAVLETRWLPVDGLPTSLQLLDVDGDGIQDLVVLNSSVSRHKNGVNILYGPLWERAQVRQ